MKSGDREMKTVRINDRETLVDVVGHSTRECQNGVDGENDMDQSSDGEKIEDVEQKRQSEVSIEWSRWISRET